ncbi:hypothetical protein MBLNU459_g5292t1 [Dothideomycetes sp. NU459]
MAIKNVALVGANGKLGPAILSALLSSGAFTVTVISRKSSKSRYPDTVHVRHVSDDLPSEELVDALRGQDALVVVFAGSNSDLQIRLADASAEAGIQRFIPADFGSCDSSSPRALELVPLYKAKQKVRQHLQDLASRSSLTWTSLVCGHFFDYGLKSGLLQFDLEARKVRIFDGGDIKASATTLETIGLATVRVLEHDRETSNRMLYIQSFRVTQNEMLKSLEQITDQKWQVENVKSDDYINRLKEEMQQNPNDEDVVENMVSVVGIVDSNWESKDDFANNLLTLEHEDPDQVISRIVRG